MRAYSADAILRLSGLIYDAAVDTEKWVLFLEELGRTIDGHTLNLATIGRSSGVSMSAVANADPNFLRDYNAHYGSLDPWLAATKQAGILRPGAADVGERFVPPSALVKTEFYSDFGRRYEVIGGISGVFTVDGILTALSVSQHKFSQFGETELGLIQQLLPHIQRALTVHQRIVAAESMSTSARSVLDRMPHAVFFLSRAGKLMTANRPGADLLRRRDGLTADHGELRAGTPSQTTLLRGVIATALSALDRIVDGADSVTLLDRGDGRRPLAAVAIPVKAIETALVPHGAAVALIVTDPEQSRTPHVEEIRSVLRLTAGEARLVHCLAEGLTIKESADRLGIDPETARKRLKVVFQKTNVHRQADLVRLVLLTTLPDVRD